MHPVTDNKDRFLVAEIGKNWFRSTDGVPVQSSPGGYRWAESPALQGHPLGMLFEAAIEYNLNRGYRLHSFQLHRLMVDADTMNETIIAVFEQQETPDGD